jgi:hypothetical protein
MNRSDIFNAFVKIAQEKGLVEGSPHAEHTEKDFHETNPRHDSLTIEQISKLYNNKTPAPKDMEYKNNIMEIAHPKMEVLFQAYDKVNGLVESEQEGQNIRIRLTLKEPDGHYIQRKLAEKQLIMSLVKLANNLDNHHQDALCKLADVCLIQAAGKPFKKVSFFLPIIGAIASAVGLLYVQQHMNFHSDGFVADYQKTINEIDDLLTSNTNLGVGYSYTPQFLQEMTKLKSDLGQIYNAVKQALPIIHEVEKPKTKSQKLQEMARISQDTKTKAAVQAADQLGKVLDEYQPEIKTVLINFQNQSYKNEVIADKGTLSKLVDWTGILHGGGGLVADDFDDVERALSTLQEDILGIQKALIQAEQIKQDFTAQVPQSAPEEVPTQEASPPKSILDDTDDDLKNIVGE